LCIPNTFLGLGFSKAHRVRKSMYEIQRCVPRKEQLDDDEH